MTGSIEFVDHVHKPSPAVQLVWFGWHCGLGIFPYEEQEQEEQEDQEQE